MTRETTVPWRRRVARLGLAAAVAAGGLVVGAVSSPAGATTNTATTISGWASADWKLDDAKKTTVTIAAGVETWGPVLKPNQWQTKQTVSVKVGQNFCTVVSGKDVLVTRQLATEQPASNVTMLPQAGKGSVKTNVTLTGTETKTPAGTGGDCNEPDASKAVTTPMTVSATADASYSNAKNSNPLYWVNEYEGGAFYYRDAKATGSLKSSALGINTLGNSASGWFWGGVWLYPQGT